MIFTCNVCGTRNAFDPERSGRESADCDGCGSTQRMRSVVGLLTRELFGTLDPIASLPERRDLRGVGLSDWDGYATRLAARMDYTNTYYHQAPFLDITDVRAPWAGSCDFLISTDVFEHVLAPVNRAFLGARRLLKPGGVLILTVPYALETDQTLEHFPLLQNWRLEQDADGAWVLRDARQEGDMVEYRDLIFHGGPGSTLEMRLFSRDSLLRELRDAGFSHVRIADEAMPEIGVIRQETWSLPIVARA
jgi:SAM-dependent methyltransferase